MRVSMVMLLALFLGGCCATSRCYIARAQTALEAADPIAVKSIGAACRPKVEAECRGKGEGCDAFKRCKAALVGYQAARKVIGDALVELNRALAVLGVK